METTLPAMSIGQGQIVNMEDQAMSIESILGQIKLIQDIMEKVMKKDEHYGVIPGTKKPTLLKPGAEKLILTFRLDPDYEIIREVRDKDFIAYTVKCCLTHIPTGKMIASGIGSCNSRETKYRFRYIEESTGVPVPEKYWAAKKKNNSKEMKRLLQIPNYKGELRAAKIDGQWMIAKAEKIENDNPWDLDNTLIKMACKRGLIASTLNATAASDIFTQDLEDLPPEGIIKNGTQKPETQKPETKKAGPKKTENQKLTDEQYSSIIQKIDAISELDNDDKKKFFEFIRNKHKESITLNGKPVLTITIKGADKILKGFDALLSEFSDGKISTKPPAEEIEEPDFMDDDAPDKDWGEGEENQQ